MAVYGIQGTGYDTFYPYGKRLGVESGGRLWAMYNGTSNHYFEYSDDDGATWTAPTNGQRTVSSSYEYAGGFVIAGDDAIYHIYSSIANQHYLYVERGVFTPGAPGSIAWTVSTYAVTQSVYYSDLTVHPEGTNYRVHVAYRRADTGDNYHSHILWSGSWGSWSASDWIATYGWFASIDWNHSATDATVVRSGENPDLYMAMTNANSVVYFFKGTWSSGPSWSWSSVANHYTNTASDYAGMTFDGNYIWFAQRYSTDWTKYHLFCRNRANDTWYDIGQTPALSNYTGWGSLTYDPEGNLYLFGNDIGNDAQYIKWTKSSDGPPPTGTFAGSWTEWEAGTWVANTQNMGPYPDQGFLHAIWEDSGTGIRYGVGPAFNQDPTAPDWVAPEDNVAQDVAETLLLDWTFNDPDSGDTQGAYTVRRKLGAAAWYYWNGATWDASESGSTKISSATESLTLASSWGSDGDDTHSYGVKTWDQDDAGPSDWSDDIRAIPSGQDNPTLDAIGTIDSKVYTVTWTVSTQTKLQVKVFRDVGLADLEYDSGIVVSGTKEHDTSFLEEGTRYVWVQTYNDEGLASDVDTDSVTVDWSAPPTPSVTVDDTHTTGAIRIEITNPAPGGGESSSDWNEIYRRIEDDETTEIRIAYNVTASGTFFDWVVATGVEYKYQPVAWNEANETSTEGAWTA